LFRFIYLFTFFHFFTVSKLGYTNATLQEISFNIDSKWVNVTSSRGTTRNIFFFFAVLFYYLFIYLFYFFLYFLFIYFCYLDIFAINRTGGVPNVYTHLREFRTKADAVPLPFTNAKTTTLSPSCRIHQTPVVDDYLGKVRNKNICNE
jgi:hypothetical protein